MARDIEEFLRRAAERRKQQQAGQQQPAPPPRQQQQRPQPRPQAPAQPPRRLVIDDSSEIEIVELSEQDMRHQSVAQHVKSHINTSDISEHVSHLGEGIAGADDRVAARLHKKFDHDLSKIDDKPITMEAAAVVTKASISPIVQDLIAMLQSPKTIRQAILINEILTRPKFDDE